MIGNTSSTLGIATSGAYNTFNFGGEAFLAKFSSNGTIQWATYYGGVGGTDGNGVTTDIQGNAYITGSTTSPAGSGIATNGAYQTSRVASDAFLAKFSGNGSIIWGTYFGGLSYDWGYGISADHFGNVYITGSTMSDTNIATKGAFQTSFEGPILNNIAGVYGGDAFLAKFDTSGKIKWATYYGGKGVDQAVGIATDISENVFISGTTSSDSGIVTNGAFQTSLSGGVDAFIVKFNENGTREWATYYGNAVNNAYNNYGNINYYNNDIATDNQGNIYMSGIALNSSGIATRGSYLSSYSPKYGDGYVVKFNNDGIRQWGTYYAGISRDIAADVAGNVYVTGATQDSFGVATNGAYQTVFGGNDWFNNTGDAFLAKFGNLINDAGIDSFITPIGNYCVDTVPVSFILKNSGNKELDSVKINLTINGNILTTYNWFGHLKADSTLVLNFGNYKFPPGPDIVKVWTYNPNGFLDSFPQNDTAVSKINIYPLPNANAGPDTILCYHETYTMQGSGGVSYTWHPATYLSSANNPNAIAVLPNTEQYVLVVSNTIGCNDSASVLLKVRPKIKVKALVNNTTVCYGESITLSAEAEGGDSLHYKYNWVNDSLTGDSVTKKIYRSGWHKIKLSDNCSPTPGIDSIYITVISPVKSVFTWVPIQNNIQKRPVQFLNQSANATNYLWIFGNGDSGRIQSPVYTYADTGTYKVMLVANNQNQCPGDTAFGTITIISNEVNIYIPNAFSPNRDGINDVFNISGIGIKSYSYNIYNQWGEHIYASPNLFLAAKSQGTPQGEVAGWDGTFKGKQVPQGIYIYQLDLVDIFGDHHFLNGNITLMR